MGGTGTGEDFAGFTVYAIHLNDLYDSKDLSRPYVVVSVSGVQTDRFLDDSATYQLNVDLQVVTGSRYSQTINSVAYDKLELLNYLLDRFELLMRNFNFGSTVTEIENRLVTTVTPTLVKTDDGFAFEGGVALTTNILITTA